MHATAGERALSQGDRGRNRDPNLCPRRTLPQSRSHSPTSRPPHDKTKHDKLRGSKRDERDVSGKRRLCRYSSCCPSTQNLWDKRRKPRGRSLSHNP